MKKQPLILIDAGHGHLVEGIYQTAGKRYEDEDVKLYEGILNKAVAYNLALRLSLDNIPCEIINPQNKDLSLDTRIRKANSKDAYHNCLYLSIHHNAHSNDLAHGCEIFTSVGDTLADPLAEILGTFFLNMFTHRELRRSPLTGKLSKEARFRVLHRTRMPAILTEFGFMTGAKDRPYITSDEGIKDHVTWLKVWIDYLIQTRVL